MARLVMLEFEERARVLKGKLAKLEEIVEKELGDVTVNVVFVDKETISKLNSKFRKKRGATDVLTFPYGDEDLFGEIYVCLDVVEENARAFNNTLERELVEVVVHGILHLAGYDHEYSKENEKEMFEKQTKYVEEVMRA